MIVILIFIMLCGSVVAGWIHGIVQWIKEIKQNKLLAQADLQQDEEEEKDIHESERIMLLDETIVKYNKLLDNLTEQYNNTYDEKERSRILSKQIITLEKLNKALEKRERLEN